MCSDLTLSTHSLSQFSCLHVGSVAVCSGSNTSVPCSRNNHSFEIQFTVELDKMKLFFFLNEIIQGAQGSVSALCVEELS